jgi:hypothetical protein
LEEWKSKRQTTLQEEFAGLKIDTEKKAQLKATEEVQMIKDKLVLELEEKKRKFLKEQGADLGVSCTYSLNSSTQKLPCC